MPDKEQIIQFATDDNYDVSVLTNHGRMFVMTNEGWSLMDTPDFTTFPEAVNLMS